MGSKRGAEHSQASKEELAALEARSSSREPTGTFSRAPAEELAGRRVIRRSDNSKWQSPPGSSNRGSTSNNPFTGIRLTSATNPFTGIPTPSTSRYSLDAPRATPASNSRRESLVKNFQAHVKKVSEDRPKESWAVAVQEFLDFGMALGIASAGATPATHAATALTPASTIATVAPTPKTPFSFGSPPVAASVPTPGTLPTPAATAPAGPTPAPAATIPTPAATTVPTPTTAPTPAAAPAAAPTPGSDDWIEFHQVTAGYYKCTDAKEGWSKHEAGSLKLLYKRGIAKSKSMVLRNPVTGFVQATWPLPSQLKLETIQKKTGQKQYINFMFAESQEKMAMVRLFTKAQEIEELFSKMKELRDKQV